MNKTTLTATVALLAFGSGILLAAGAREGNHQAQLDASATIDWSTIAHTPIDARGVSCYRPTDTIGLACVKVR